MTTRKLFAACALFASLAASVAHAGRVSGPGAMPSETVNAHSSTSFSATFIGGEMAEVIIVGDGDTDLDLYIYDENGNLIVSDTDSLDVCICEWMPNWTGEFTVVVTNLGSVYNEFDLATN